MNEQKCNELLKAVEQKVKVKKSQLFNFGTIWDIGIDIYLDRPTAINNRLVDHIRAVESTASFYYKNNFVFKTDYWKIENISITE